MKRNFSNESAVNLALRALKALTVRLRGIALSSLGAFATGSGYPVYFGRGLRMINSKSIKFGGRNAFGIFARIECHGDENGGDPTLPLIDIGNNTSFGDYFHAGAIKGIRIGNNVLGGSNILIVDHSHGNPSVDMETRTHVIPRERPLTSKGAISIADNVWIGDNCVILGGSDIGLGAIIAANAVVAGAVAPYTIYFGRSDQSGRAHVQ